jgi:hypothetical protein
MVSKRNCQIKTYIDNAVCKVLGIDGLYGGFHEEKQADGTWTNKYNIEYLWIATLKGIWWTDVTLGVAKIYDKRDAVPVMNGFLFVEGWDEGSFQGKQPFRPILLQQFEDPVIPRLQQVNLLPSVSHGAIPDDPESLGSFEIHTFSDKVFTSMSFSQSSLPMDENGKLLWETLLTLCVKFSRLNAEPAIVEYIDRRMKNFR